MVRSGSPSLFAPFSFSPILIEIDPLTKISFRQSKISVKVLISRPSAGAKASNDMSTGHISAHNAFQLDTMRDLGYYRCAAAHFSSVMECGA